MPFVLKVEDTTVFSILLTHSLEVNPKFYATKNIISFRKRPHEPWVAANIAVVVIVIQGYYNHMYQLQIVDGFSKDDHDVVALGVHKYKKI